MITLIGDVHGSLTAVKQALKGTKDHVLQVGDLGFSRTYMELNWFLRDNNCRDRFNFIPGNHDDYDSLPDYAVGMDYHMRKIGGYDLFCIRGAFSVDFRRRVIDEAAYDRRSWWVNEEMNYTQMQHCRAMYEKHKPSVVVSHTCPMGVVDEIGAGPDFMKAMNLPEGFVSNTSRFMESLLDIHVPDNWYFGHFHRPYTGNYRGCEFRCLGIDEAIRINPNG